MSLKLGIVTAVHPEDRSVNLVMVEDGSRLAGVQVLGEMLTDRSGRFDLHETGTSADGDEWSVTAARDQQQVIAAVGYIGRTPVVLGFMPQQILQMTFKRLNFRIDRHPSDVYSSLDNEGNFEWSHPSGSFVRVAEDPEHEDLTGQDADGKFKVDRNTARAPWLSVLIKNSGAEVARVRIDPSGNVALDHAGNLTSHTGGNAAITVDGTTTATLTGAAVLNAPAGLTINGNVATVGTLTNNGKNVGSPHTHTNVKAGIDTSGPPS